MMMMMVSFEVMKILPPPQKYTASCSLFCTCNTRLSKHWYGRNCGWYPKRLPNWKTLPIHSIFATLYSRPFFFSPVRSRGSMKQAILGHPPLMVCINAMDNQMTGLTCMEWGGPNHIAEEQGPIILCLY